MARCGRREFCSGGSGGGTIEPEIAGLGIIGLSQRSSISERMEYSRVLCVVDSYGIEPEDKNSTTSALRVAEVFRSHMSHHPVVSRGYL